MVPVLVQVIFCGSHYPGLLAPLGGDWARGALDDEVGIRGVINAVASEASVQSGPYGWMPMASGMVSSYNSHPAAGG